MPVIMSDYTKDIKIIHCINSSFNNILQETKDFCSSPCQDYLFSKDVRIRRINYGILPSESYKDVTIYVASNKNRFYTIANYKGTVYLTRVVYHDKREPYPKELWEMYEYDEDAKKIDEKNGYDTNLVDETRIVINSIDKTYKLSNHRHTLNGGSWHGNISRVTEKTLENYQPKEEKDSIKVLLIEIQEILSELGQIEGIGTILDLSLFDIIPSPDDFKGKEKRVKPIKQD